MKAVRLTAFLAFCVPVPPLQAEFELRVFLQTVLSVWQQKSYCSLLTKYIGWVNIPSGSSKAKIISKLLCVPVKKTCALFLALMILMRCGSHEHLALSDSYGQLWYNFQKVW